MTNEERVQGYLNRPPSYGTRPERYTPAQNKRLKHKANSRKTHTHTIPEFDSPGGEPRFERLPDFRCPRCLPAGSEDES